MKFFALYIPSTVCCASAGAIGFSGGDQWGWFLLLALLLAPSSNDLKEANK